MPRTLSTRTAIFFSVLVEDELTTPGSNCAGSFFTVPGLGTLYSFPLGTAKVAKTTTKGRLKTKASHVGRTPKIASGMTTNMSTKLAPKIRSRTHRPFLLRANARILIAALCFGLRRLRGLNVPLRRLIEDGRPRFTNCSLW